MTDKHEMPPRLSPPPKVGRESPVSRAVEASDRRVRADRSLLYWLTGAVFLALVATAVAVFVFLPDWVPDRTAATARPQSIAEPMTETPTSDEPTAEATVPPVAPPVADRPEVTPSQTARQSRRDPPVESPPPVAPAASSSRPADPTEVAFGQAMTEGLTRLAAGELNDAERAFGRALALRPDSPAAADGLARVESKRQLVAIALHRERAAAHEEQERWSEAVAEHDAVLALDPTILFAQEGRARAVTRRDLNEQLEAHIAHPDRLSSDAVLDDAGSVLYEAQAIDNPGPVLARQIERLAAQIRTAETKIRVVLLSDTETEILVFRVGRLGAFERRALDLRPGSYTVVGTRPGYRDVRRILEVIPGRANISLTIRCEEKI